MDQPDNISSSLANTNDSVEKYAVITKRLDEIKRAKEALLRESGNTSAFQSKPDLIADYSSRPKKLFSHPKLEFVYGEIVYSPYMISPMVVNCFCI